MVGGGSGAVYGVAGGTVLWITRSTVGEKKNASVPFIFIMFIEFGSKGADIKGLLRDS